MKKRKTQPNKKSFGGWNFPWVLLLGFGFLWVFVVVDFVMNVLWIFVDLVLVEGFAMGSQQWVSMWVSKQRRRERNREDKSEMKINK